MGVKDRETICHTEAMVEESKTASADQPRLPAVGVADPKSAMVPRFNLFFRWFAKRFFGHFDLDDATVAKLKELEAKGPVVYVMRYASRLDYFLFNALLAREGLRLSAFANGLSFYYYQPLLGGLRTWFARRRLFGKERREADRAASLERARAVVEAGESMFLFLRTARFSTIVRGRDAAIEQGRQELDLLRAVVGSTWEGKGEATLVPLALFWRKGPRTQRRFLNLTYGSATRPSDLAKVSSFLLAYHDLAIKVGKPIDLAGFIETRRSEGLLSVTRKVRRSILLFLFREERAVEGPTLRPQHRVREAVMADRNVVAAVAQDSEGRGTIEASRARAERIFDEISANMNPTTLAALAAIVGWLFRKLFVRIETRGLERVAELSKRHPVVLVPSHRSYFDFLLLSWLLYQNYVIPPHIAARENMAFGPFGFLFRRVGAFFLRKSFDDGLYKSVFRSYVAYLVKEGFPQEFFIEGGRSRTGKSLAPRLGMLSWNIQGFVDSGRRELYFVPIAITYERLVEEGAMVSEAEGEAKQDESMLGLVRARKLLRLRFGSVFVNFGEPVSLSRELVGRRELFIGEETDERREFTERLGNEIVERINWSVVANSTSVVACAVLGEQRQGLFRQELVQRMSEIVALLRLQDVQFTPALERDEPEFRESIDFMVSSGLVSRDDDPRGEILFYDESQWRALDVYRNVILHYLAVPSWMARRLLRGATRAEVQADLGFWLELFYEELFAPQELLRAAYVDGFLDHFIAIGALEAEGSELRATEKGRADFAFLAEQTQALLEAYHVTLAAVSEIDGSIGEKELAKAVEVHFRRLHLVGEVRRAEAWNPTGFRAVLDLLERRGLVERVSGEGREKRYVPGVRADGLAALRERLAAALASG